MKFRTALTLIALTATTALAQEHHHGHPAQDQKLHKDFYSKWKIPGSNNLSCCDNRDCYPTEARFEGGTWYAKRREDALWMMVNTRQILKELSPDGRAHVCAAPPNEDPNSYTLYCFVPPDGQI